MNTAADEAPRWAARLSEAAGEAVSAPQARLMRQHWALVRQWSPKLNLSGTEDPEEALERHFCDSLQVLRHLDASGPLADIGSGAGFPGLPVAVMRPSVRIYLVEPRHRRGAFLQVVAARLGLTNVQVRIQRAEAGPPELCRSLMTRATFAEDGALGALAAWLAPGGALVAQRSCGDGEDARAATSLGAAFGPGRRFAYPLAGRPRACDVWIRTPR